MDLNHLLNQTTIGVNKNDEGDEGDENDGNDGNDGAVSGDAVNESIAVSGDAVNESNQKDTSSETEEVVGETVEEMIDPRFTQPWNKLEKGSKMNRILVFVESEKEEKQLSDNLSKDLKNLLFRACETGMFNKVTDVKYENGLIESFKHLEFNESTKKYKLKTGGTKTRSVSKSRSNLDRLMKKK